MGPQAGLILETTGECVVGSRPTSTTSTAIRPEENGEFAASTRIAVLDFQGRNGLPADGNIGGTTTTASSQLGPPRQIGTRSESEAPAPTAR
jgi:murein L,D-transpeptidase YcbB/YkuD